MLRFSNTIGEMYGYEPQTTNNRMELRAVIEGLNGLKEPCGISLYTDSTYVKHGITEWIHGWKRRGWVRRTAEGVVPIPNTDLWVELDRAVSRHQIEWHWVKGHASDPDNIRCDELAYDAAKKRISSNGVIRLHSAKKLGRSSH